MVLKAGELLPGVERGASTITTWPAVDAQQQLVVGNDRDLLYAGANVHTLIFSSSTGGW
jgi:hypothetical protein